MLRGTKQPNGLYESRRRKTESLAHQRLKRKVVNSAELSPNLNPSPVLDQESNTSEAVPGSTAYRKLIFVCYKLV